MEFLKTAKSKTSARTCQISSYKMPPFVVNSTHKNFQQSKDNQDKINKLLICNNLVKTDNWAPTSAQTCSAGVVLRFWRCLLPFLWLALLWPPLLRLARSGLSAPCLWPAALFLASSRFLRLFLVAGSTLFSRLLVIFSHSSR